MADDIVTEDAVKEDPKIEEDFGEDDEEEDLDVEGNEVIGLGEDGGEFDEEDEKDKRLSSEGEDQEGEDDVTVQDKAFVEEAWGEMPAEAEEAYTDLDQFITPKELVYMLKALNLHTHTPEQMMELIEFCVRPPHPDNHVNFDQFVWIVTIRQRDMPVEEEIRLALEAFDPENTGLIDREYLREYLRDHGKKMKTVDMFIREVDMTNDGNLGREDIVSTICVDLNRDEIETLLNKIYPPEEAPEDNVEALTS
ncbi:hypothetical protein NE865_12959 [Phthorimaea operculella]|nr:hypothetical protein NE865_12959 [Phthorimaea operculella]